MFPPIDMTVLSAFVLVAADRIPTFNVEPFCRAVASRAVPVGDASICVRKEMEARNQLPLRAALDDRGRSDLYRAAHLPRVTARRQELAREGKRDHGTETEIAPRGHLLTSSNR